LYGDGIVIAENSSSSASLYKVQLEFGVAFLRSDALVHHLHSDASNTHSDIEVADDNKLVDDMKTTAGIHASSFFATESIYLFVRVYCLILQILSRIKECIDDGALQHTDSSGVFTSVSSANPANSKARTYMDILGTVKEYIKGEIDLKTLEIRCRTFSRTSVYLSTSLPHLLEKLYSAYSMVCKEDLLIPLFDQHVQRPMVSKMMYEISVHLNIRTH
jgi:histone deacetylase complex regulatory component SIN3